MTTTTTERPTVNQLRLFAHKYPNWMICARCHGGRGMLVTEKNLDTGEDLHSIEECNVCNGERVIPR